MKINICGLVLLFCFSTVFVQNTVTEVTYKTILNFANLSEKMTDKYSKSEINTIVNSRSGYDAFNYTLLFNNYESVFWLNPIEVGMESEGGDNNQVTLYNREKDSKFYKNLKDKIWLENFMSSGDGLLLLTLKEEKVEWDITTETKKIGKQTCYKANLNTGKEVYGYSDMSPDISVWFTPEIAVPFGPKSFGNLPGLILEASIGPRTYYATSIKYNVDKTINKLTEGKPITREAYRASRAKF
ncbi:GLPGLI family protein [uncultured Formosa sp.]|uniref:GLPGLI family protein n=1 Tax=uncultured Formosa sp. TaxID=255435 RepID=UPI002603A5DD|nr:GLPGLI family protein [uncultured Formosa sp.]